jgi:hypothetical protein
LEEHVDHDEITDAAEGRIPCLLQVMWHSEGQAPASVNMSIYAMNGGLLYIMAGLKFASQIRASEDGDDEFSVQQVCF